MTKEQALTAPLSQVHSGFWMFVQSLQKPLCFGRINPNRVSTERDHELRHPSRSLCHWDQLRGTLCWIKKNKQLHVLHSCTCHCNDTPCYLYSHVSVRILYNAGRSMRGMPCNRIATGLADAGKIDGNCCMFILFLCHCSSAQRRGNKLLRIQRLAPGKGSTWPRRTATWNNKIKRIKLTLIRCQPIQSTWTNVLCPPCPDCMTGWRAHASRTGSCCHWRVACHQPRGHPERVSCPWWWSSWRNIGTVAPGKGLFRLGLESNYLHHIKEQDQLLWPIANRKKSRLWDASPSYHNSIS